MEGIKGLLIFTRQMGLIIVWGGGKLSKPDLTCMCVTEGVQV